MATVAKARRTWGTAVRSAGGAGNFRETWRRTRPETRLPGARQCKSLRVSNVPPPARSPAVRRKSNGNGVSHNRRPEMFVLLLVVSRQAEDKWTPKHQEKITKDANNDAAGSHRNAIENCQAHTTTTSSDRGSQQGQNVY